MQLGTPLWLQSGDAGRGPPSGSLRGRVDLEDVPLDTAILIVEDEALIAWTLHDMLMEMGFTDVRRARDAGEAFELAGVRHPGLLICDINLGPGEDGIATAARICAVGRVPVLFITGYAGDAIRALIETAHPGAPLLRKPIEARPLAGRLREALRRAKPH